MIRDGRRWTQADELAAVAIERADMWGFRLAQASRAFKRLEPMPPIEHPDRRRVPAGEVAVPRMSSRSEIHAFMRKVSGA